MIKKIATSLLWLSSLPLCMYTLFAYFLGYTIVWEHWFAGFVMMSIPIAQGACLVLGLLWLYIRPSRAWVFLVIWLMGWPFTVRTLHISPNNDNTENDLTVLSYNVFSFQGLKPSDKEALFDYIEHSDADIKCFQEFSKTSNEEGKFAADLLKKEYPYRALNANPSHYYSTLAIYSKYPIIRKKGKAFPGNSTSNGYLLADIIFRKDTVRIINLQLQSMGIRVGKVAKAFNNKDEAMVKTEGRDILSSLKKGFIDHAREIKSIEKLIDESPYPVIVCGDFNEMPYGLAYGHVRDRLENAFEKAGNGFGFTLNRSPKFVRIDNQFFSEKIKIHSFTTHSEIKYSDHYPISASYTLP
jgi:endonuclease/exonuclease/phosphatase family metal-dependent hydrolase